MNAGTEGLSRNVVICGLDSGTIKIWDAFDLSFLSEMKNEKETSPSTHHHHQQQLSIVALYSPHTTRHDQRHDQRHT
jgi:hypothetical protein